MNIPKIRRAPSAGNARRAFTLAEMLVTMAVMGVVFIALLAGLNQGYKTIGLARENLRATQILVEKAELLRLYTWSQATNSTSFPPFTVKYDPATNGGAQGITYTGTFSVAPLASSTVQDKKLKDANYADQMRVVTITLNWSSGSQQRSRSLSTLVASTGIQSYVY